MPEEEEVFDLPEDIIVKILCRLPVKSLIRFSCVPKRWRSIIISDPQFAKSHLQLASEQRTLRHGVLVSTISVVEEDFYKRYPTLTGNSQLQCLEDFSGDTFRVRSCTFPSEQHSTIVMASCNGLVILGSYYEDLSIWNPSTGFFRKIPDPQFSSRTKRTCRDISGRYGFGYVSATDDYKLVLVIPDEDSGAAEDVYEDMDINIFIFSVGANSWSTRKGSHWSFLPIGWRMHCGGFFK